MKQCLLKNEYNLNLRTDAFPHINNFMCALNLMYFVSCTYYYLIWLVAMPLIQPPLYFEKYMHTSAKLHKIKHPLKVITT